MTDDDMETLGRLVDKLDGLVSASILPLPSHIHIAGLTGAMAAARDELRALLVGKGFNPWRDR